MSKVAVVYYSGTGNTEEMAKAVLKGAEAAGAEARLFTSDEFQASMMADFDAYGFGCPASGAEELESSSFQPMFESVEKDLKGKKTGLFGSYGWGGGTWMESWIDQVKADGAELVDPEGVIVNGAPDDETLAKCENLGKLLAA